MARKVMSMKIGPLFEGRNPASLTSGPLRPLPAAKDFREGDSVDISGESRKKLARSADELLKLEQTRSPVYSRKDFATNPAKSAEIKESPSRNVLLREITDRIASGYYDRQDITFLVADKLSDDFYS